MENGLSNTEAKSRNQRLGLNELSRNNLTACGRYCSGRPTALWYGY
ncbi:hypothetical protein [Dyadobacter sp. 50-39]